MLLVKRKKQEIREFQELKAWELSYILSAQTGKKISPKDIYDHEEQERQREVSDEEKMIEMFGTQEQKNELYKQKLKESLENARRT